MRFFPTLPSHQDEQSSIAKPDARLCELSQSLSERGQRIAATLVANARQTEASRPYGASLTDGISAHQVLHHLALHDGLQNFFERRPEA